MPDPRNTLDAWLRYLETLHPAAIEMGLERVAAVAQRLLDFSVLPPVITVTGTNGKGSTAMSVEALAMAHGLLVGTYTSPHLLSYNERVRIHGLPVTDEALIESFHAVETARQSISLTYFEFGTLSALWLFARANLSLLVLEVGLGGRLDAVNIVSSRVAVITSIALDHEAWLGNTREQVCFEKAGIRRAGCPVVCGDRHPPDNLRLLCAETHSPLYLIGHDYDFFSRAMPVKTLEPKKYWQVPNTSLLPDNMATALQALFLADVCQLNESLAMNALASLEIPGRRQCVQSTPAVYVDVGHNPHAAASLAQWIQTAFGATESGRPGRIIALVGMLADKDYRSTLAALVDVVDLWVPVSLSGPRALTGDALAEILSGFQVNTMPSQSGPLEGLSKILEQSVPSDTIIAFGSFHTVAEILAHYTNGPHGK